MGLGEGPARVPVLSDVEDSAGPRHAVGRRIYGTTEGGRDFYFVADVRNNEEQTFHVTRRSSSFSVPARERQTALSFQPGMRGCVQSSRAASS